MKKVVVSREGRIGIIDGPNAESQRLTWTTPEGFDPTVEEFEVNCSKEQLRKLKKNINEKGALKEFRKFHVRRLYKRGDNPRLDRKRDAVDLQE